MRKWLIALLGSIPLILSSGCHTESQMLFPVDTLSSGEFAQKFEVPCNRIFTREIGLKFDPPIKADGVRAIWDGIPGHVSIRVNQGNRSLDRKISLEDASWVYSGGGLPRVTLVRFSPLRYLFCGKQRIEIYASGVGSGRLDLKQRSVSIYVSKDRRP